METGIRLASHDDLESVAAFFTSVYEARHGVGSARNMEMLQRTVSSLFGDNDALTVLVSESAGLLQGVAAVKHSEVGGPCELVTIQTNDSVQGRGVAQTLLRQVIEMCASRGGTVLATGVPMADVRARGFLRREGFVVSAEEPDAGRLGADGSVTYRLDVVEAFARAARAANSDGVE